MPTRSLLLVTGMALLTFPDVRNIGDRFPECRVKTFKYISMCNCLTESLQFVEKLVLGVN